MRIGLITSAPDHPVLAATTALLTARGHHVEVLDPTAGPDGPFDPPADVYLLKAHSPAGLALARGLEERGVPVVNPVAATELCQDRLAMAELARRAGLPFAPTRAAADLAELLGAVEAGELLLPIVVKSRHSRRHDLVARVDDTARLRALAEEWPDEPVVAQPYLPSTGWDQKLWVVAGQLFCARRRSELAGPEHAELPDGAAGFGPAELSADRAAVALRAGEVFGLDVYGVDLLDGPGEPVVVDVNAFPGIRGQAGAPEALAALALRVGGAGSGVPRPRADGTGTGAATPAATPAAGDAGPGTAAG
ncbi:alpha-L-glutamate ligase [Kitasatospora purpeofusca]|uniref:Alpha-L-glutamate ligase n=1 Tax=Kitasatospora purpeofusca TaxID=67352 RepID=A0ABZ1U4N3_9ACTN|nr:alpha-L-glutamate ligase [Kitasatospora purpeofusca]